MDWNPKQRESLEDFISSAQEYVEDGNGIEFSAAETRHLLALLLKLKTATEGRDQ
jgi:hypothetical protein